MTYLSLMDRIAAMFGYAAWRNRNYLLGVQFVKRNWP